LAPECVYIGLTRKYVSVLTLALFSRRCFSARFRPMGHSAHCSRHLHLLCVLSGVCLSVECVFVDLSSDQRYHKGCEEKHSNTTAHHPVVSVGVCYTAVDAAAGGLTTGRWAVVLECYSSDPLFSTGDASLRGFVGRDTVRAAHAAFTCYDKDQKRPRTHTHTQRHKTTPPTPTHLCVGCVCICFTGYSFSTGDASLRLFGRRDTVRTDLCVLSVVWCLGVY